MKSAVTLLLFVCTLFLQGTAFACVQGQAVQASQPDFDQLKRSDVIRISAMVAYAWEKINVTSQATTDVSFYRCTSTGEFTEIIETGSDDHKHFSYRVSVDIFMFDLSIQELLINESVCLIALHLRGADETGIEEMRDRCVTEIMGVEAHAVATLNLVLQQEKYSDVNEVNDLYGEISAHLQELKDTITFSFKD